MRKATISFLYVRRPFALWNISDPTRLILMKSDIWYFFESLSRKFKFHENPTRIIGTLHKDVFTFIKLSRYIFLRIRNVLDKCCRETQNTHFIFNTFLSKIVPFMRQCRKTVQREGPQMTSQYGAYALHATEARLNAPDHPSTTYTHARTHTHTHKRTHADKYVILLAFPRQR